MKCGALQVADEMYVFGGCSFYHVDLLNSVERINLKAPNGFEELTFKDSHLLIQRNLVAF
jgi:hypothetical protein